MHANPFQQVMPVPAYGLERVGSAIADVAEVEILEPFFHEDPYEALRERLERLDPDIVGFGIRIVEDCIVVDSPDGPGHTDTRSFLPELGRLRDVVAAAAPRATVVAGGATFSYMPAELLDALELDWGVVGAGEETFRELVTTTRDEWPGIPGVVARGGGPAQRSLAIAPGVRTQRHPQYSGINDFPVRTRVGCAMACSYCLTAALGRAHAQREVADVVSEVAEVVAHCERQSAVARVFFADDEFNLPDAGHALAILEAIASAGFGSRLSWRAYFNPTPLPDRLAELAAATNGHISLTVDSASDPVLAKNGKPFRRRHLDAAIETILEHGVRADLGFIFGLPGETAETIAETVEFIRSLPPHIEVSYSSGARVYPHTPLAQLAAADPGNLHGEATLAGRGVYSAPEPPRELAALLARALHDAPNVCPVGVGYERASRVYGLAHQALSTGDRARRAALWQDALDSAAAGGYRQPASDMLDRLFELALWHNQADLALSATRALRRLPADDRPMSTTRLVMTEAILAGAAALHRLKWRGGGLALDQA